MSKKFKGNISISRSTSNVEPYQCVHLTLQDDTNYVTVVDLRMPLEDFAKALFTQGNIPCEAELVRPDLVGKILEVKTIEIDTSSVKGGSYKTEEKRRAALARLVSKHEVDGWHGEPEDLINFHRRVPGKNNTYKVSFRRFVDPPKGGEEQ